MSACCVTECERNAAVHGMCKMHYQRHWKTGSTDTKPRQKVSLQERFMAKVERIPEAGCWIWTGALDNQGYARINRGLTAAGNALSAHASHVAWDLFVGTPRDGLNLCHRCDTPACVAPHHLFLGTHKENMEDMVAKGRGADRTKEYCKRGHKLSGDNVYLWLNGKGRSCRACANILAKQYNAAKPKKPRELAQFCGKGHEFTPDNTYQPPKGSRQCIACRRLVGMRHDQKRRSPASLKETT